MKNLMLYLMLVITASLLSGCPLPTTNMMEINNPNATNLPNPLHRDKALIYIVKPYKDVSWFFGVDAAVSEGHSEAYIQSLINKDERYLGPLGVAANPICLYVDPGRYQLKFFSQESKPKELFESIEVDANKAYFYGLYGKSYGGEQSLEFQFLSETQGKNYLKKAYKLNPCRDFSSLPQEIPGYHLSIKLQIINESQITYVITEKDGNQKTLTLEPNQKISYQLAVGSKAADKYKLLYYSTDKTLVFRNQNKKTENEIHIGPRTNMLDMYVKYLKLDFFIPKVEAFITLNSECQHYYKPDGDIQCTAVISEKIPKEFHGYPVSLR